MVPAPPTVALDPDVEATAMILRALMDTSPSRRMDTLASAIKVGTDLGIFEVSMS